MLSGYEIEINKNLSTQHKYDFLNFANYRHKLIDNASQKNWEEIELVNFINSLYINEIAEFVNKYTNNKIYFNKFIKKYGKNSFLNIINNYFCGLDSGFARISTFEQNYFSMFYNSAKTVFVCELKIEHLQSLSDLQEPYLDIFKKTSLVFFKKTISQKFVYNSVPCSFGNAHSRQYTKGYRKPEMVKQIIDFMKSKEDLYSANEINEMVNLYCQAIFDRTKIHYKRFDSYSIKPTDSTMTHKICDNFYEKLNGLYLEDLKYLLALSKNNIGNIAIIENLILMLPTHNLENESERLDILIDFAIKIPQTNSTKIYEIIRQNKNNLSVATLATLAYNTSNLKPELIEDFKNELKLKDLKNYLKLEETYKHNNVKITILKKLKGNLKKLYTLAFEK